jgi:hypothetical protein
MAGAVSATSHVIVEFIGLFLAGMLAGSSLSSATACSPLLAGWRIGLTYSHASRSCTECASWYPLLIVPTVVAAVVTVVLDGNGTGCWFCWAGPRGTDRLPGNCVRGNRAHQRPGDRMGRRQPTRGLGDRDQTVGADRRVLLLRRDPRLRAVPQRSRAPADRVLMKR